jgi:methionine aminotransferase
MQVALSRFLKEPAHYLDLAPRMQKKRDYLRQLLSQTPLKLIPSYGSYFELYSYEGLSDEPERELAIRMVKECGVATIPVSVFYQDGTDQKLQRFCFCKKEETLENAVERLMWFKW